MKLYTEEQLHNTVVAVSNYLDDINLGRAQEKIEKHLKALQPIVLPSDEEIAEGLKKVIGNIGEVEHRKLTFIGALWLKEQILNQNE